MNFDFLKNILANINSKVAQNNYKKLLLNKKNKKIKVVFHLYEKSKWKCQALYDAFLNDENFDVQILITKYYSKNKKDVNHQTNEQVLDNFNYFKNKNLNVELAYDTTRNKFIPLERFNPDVIIYQHPWGINKVQHPHHCSKFSLCYYIPYSVYPSNLKIEYNLNFYKYLYKYCVLDKKTLEFYFSKSKLKNLITTGNPWFDNYQTQNSKEKYVIYAPHFSFNNQGIGYGTFEWNGEYILEFAKQHPEFSWIFKPHPLFKNALYKNNFMNNSKIEAYFNAWKEIGAVHENEEYIDLFNSSKLLITDCGSFLVEYLPTKKPLIRLTTNKSASLYKEICNNYYQAKNIDELKEILNEVLINNNDYKKNERNNAKMPDFINKSASFTILNDIKNEFNLNN